MLSGENVAPNNVVVKNLLIQHLDRSYMIWFLHNKALVMKLKEE